MAAAPKRARARSGSVPVTLNVRIPIDLHQELEGIAGRHGVAYSDVARMALRRGLANADREIARAIERSQHGAPDA